MNFTVAFTLLGSLALLMFGMKTLSEGLQKMAGPQLRNMLQKMTANRFMGAFTGMLVTASIQSSTATTLMTVSFVNAGLLTLAQAISIILGAHVGTTVTAWIMNLGFAFDISLFAYIAAFVGIIMIYMKKQKNLGEFLFGMAFLFLGLVTLRKTGMAMELDQNPDVIEFFKSFDPSSLWTTLTFLLIGTVLTLCVQSSAAIMAITMTLCCAGVLHIDQGVMLVLGENIGTTITVNIVALRANTMARRAAFAHLGINVFGVTWALILLKPFVNLVCSIVGYDSTLTDPSAAGYSANLAKSAMTLAAFHTLFNIVNTFLLIWFIPYIERFVCWAINSKKTVDEEEDFRLHFITSGLMKTPELSVLEAHKEIRSYANRMQRMFGMVRELLIEKDKQKFGKLFSRIEKYESISDNMEVEIAKYLNQISSAHLSDDTKQKICAMIREISELESIGDACYNIARTINRKVSGNKDHFTENQYQHLHQMMELSNTALTQMNELMAGRKEAFNVNRTFNIENEINNYRNQLKLVTR